MKLSLATLAFACLAAVQAFTVLPSARVSVRLMIDDLAGYPCLDGSFLSDTKFHSFTQTRLSLMTPDETESLLKRAEDCADSECAIDDVAELVDLLHTQQKELYERVQKIKETVDALEKINKAEDRPVDEIRETVRAIFRVFQLGDKGKCQKTATAPALICFVVCVGLVSCCLSLFFFSTCIYH